MKYIFSKYRRSAKPERPLKLLVASFSVFALVLNLVAPAFPGFGGQPVYAATVDAVYEAGNPTCGDGYVEYKIDEEDLVPGPHDDGTLEVDVEFMSDKVEELETEYLAFNWSSNVAVHTVIVKAGNGANIYDYSPAGSTGDDDLESPLNNGGQQAGISHISFCYVDDNGGDGGDSETGTLVITKYICEEGTEFNDPGMVPDTQGDATIPDTCQTGEVAGGYEFGMYHQPNKSVGDFSGPYAAPGDFDDISGATDDSGQLEVVLDAGGRYDLAEQVNNAYPYNPDGLLAFACADDAGDTQGVPDHTDNYEATFIEADQTDYCNVYNIGDLPEPTPTPTVTPTPTPTATPTPGPDVTITLVKIVCEDYSDVTGNGMAHVNDDSDENYVEFKNYDSEADQPFPGVYPYKPVSPDEIPEECQRASGWKFLLSTDQEQSQNTYQTELATNTDGEIVINSNDLPEALKNAFYSGNLVWISEIEQPDVASFAAFRCYNDALNGDNLEYIQVNTQNLPSEVYCIAYNVGEYEEPIVPNPDVPCVDNMLINGSFEFPVVTHSANWDIYPSGTAGLGWYVDWTAAVGNTYGSDDRPDIANIELHQGAALGWNSQEGDQHAELDSDWYGPDSGTSGEPANIAISQYVNAMTGQQYTLKYWVLPRPGQEASSQVEVEWNSNTIVPTATGMESGLWKEYEYEVTGEAGVDQLSFIEVGAADSFGTFLDNVSLVKTSCASTVTLCKYDTQEAALPGWTLMLLGNKVDEVVVNPNGLDHSSDNLPAGSYILKAAGTYTYRPGSDGDISDAAFSKRIPQDAGIHPSFYSGDYLPWVRVNDFGAGYAGYLGVQVNQANHDWGSVYNSGHEYYSGYSHAGGDVDFRILDDNYGDNSGQIIVEIFEGYFGTTEENGCVTFEDVPFGDYTVEEMMQSGWTMVSGTGPAEVVDSEHTFNVVNSAPQEPCTIEDGWADEVESSSQGTRKNGTNVLAARTNADSALVAEQTAADGTFFSLGVDGELIVKFDHAALDAVGDDLVIYETTNGRNSYPEETADVAVSQNGTEWYSVGAASSKNVDGKSGFDVSTTGLSWFMYVKVADTTNFDIHAADADGFDVDGIEALSLTCDDQTPENPNGGNNGTNGGNGDYTLTIILSGDGEGQVAGDGIACDSLVDGNGDCAQTYSPGTVVELTATPHDGSSFVDSWHQVAGTCTDTASPCTVTMNSDITLEARFSTDLGQGGSSFTGSRRSSSSGSVIPASTIIPINNPAGQVAGASTEANQPQTLPRTGAQLPWFLIAMCAAAYVLLSKDKEQESV